MLASPRLTYRRLTNADLQTFHHLIIDEHIREYLLDGAVMSLDWCSEQIEASQLLFDECELGLWLVSVRAAIDSPIGFCGFIRFPETGTEPQLVYAIEETSCGNGYATEMARALIGLASHLKHSIVYSAVDAPNLASSRVLEKLGFRLVRETPGAFGKIRHYELVLRNVP